MRAVFWREFRTHLRSIWVLIPISVFLALCGGMLTAFNLVLGAAGLDAILSWAGIGAALIMPILGLAFFRKDGKGTDTLLAALPISQKERLLGKYFAMLAVLAVGNAPLLLYPFVLSYVATVSFGTAYLQLLALFVCQTAMLAAVFCFFTVFRRKWVATVVSYGVLGASYLLGALGGLLPSYRAASVIKGLSIFARLDSFVFGIFDLSALLFYLSIALWFVSWTVLVMAEREEKRGIRVPHRFLCFTLAFLLMMGTNTPIRGLEWDMTESGKYAVSDSTEAFVRGLDTDVTVYLIEESRTDSVYRRFLDRFCDLSSHLTFKEISLDKDADFFAAHGLSAENIHTGSLVVESEKRFRYIPESNLLTYTNSELGFRHITKSQYQSYEYQLNYYYQITASNSAYGTQAEQYAKMLFSLYYNTTTYFGGDRILSSALDYVTAESVPVLYYLTGHGEQSLADSVLETYGLYAFEEPVRMLSLTDEGRVPSDASALIIHRPTADLTVPELSAVLEYAKAGGRLLLLTDPAFVSLENFGKLTAAFGMSTVEGAVTVTESKKNEAGETVTSESTLIHAVPNADHDALGAYEGAGEADMPLLLNANSITLVESDKTPYLLTPLLTSADTAYLPTDPSAKAAHTLAAMAEHENGMRVVWITGAETFNRKEEMAKSNAAFFMFVANATRKTFAPSIPMAEPVLYSLPNLGTTQKNVIIFGILLILLIPAALTGAGAVVTFRRKKRMPHIQN